MRLKHTRKRLKDRYLLSAKMADRQQALYSGLSKGESLVLEQKKGILCFGDSNTWGYVPKVIGSDGVASRYDENTRWTGVLANCLGTEYKVWEEGLSGRTTIYSIPCEPHKTGESHLLPTLLSCAPLSAVVLMLGSNDLALAANPPKEGQLARGVLRLGRIIQNCEHCGRQGTAPRLLLISPPHIVAKLPVYDEAQRLSHHFAEEYEQASRILGCDFLDSAPLAVPSKVDGVHLEPWGHFALGEAVAQKLLEMLI